MGDIAKAAHISRPTLYARYANKDDIFAAVFTLHVDRTLTALKAAWVDCETLSQKLDCLWAISILPSFEMITQHPDASDIIEGSDTPAGQQAMISAARQVVAAFSGVLAPYEAALNARGQTGDQVAFFVEQSKFMMLRTAKSPDDLKQQFSTLKAAVLALTS